LIKGPGARGQPARKARRLGSSCARSHPGSAANPTGTYCARSGAGFGGGHTGQGFSGTCAQPADSRIESRSQRRMWVVYLEIAVAFLLAVFIVWFTWPKNKK
jgi:hypothetical protein